jgi:hypothetical protein
VCTMNSVTPSAAVELIWFDMVVLMINLLDYDHLRFSSYGLSVIFHCLRIASLR